MYSTIQRSASSRPDERVYTASRRASNPSIHRARGYFDNSSDSRQVGEFQCLRVSHSAREGEPGCCDVPGAPHCGYALVVQLSGMTRLEQAGRLLELQPGDVSIVDGTLNYRLRFQRKNIQFALRIPRARFEGSDMDWQKCLARHAPRPVAALVGALLRCSFEQVRSENVRQQRAISDAIIGLLASCWDDHDVEQPHSVPSHGAAARLRRVQDFVIAHLGDASLSPTTIAQAQGISERQLHRLFRPTGVTVCHWIRQCRLDRCATDLLDPNQRHRLITEIALSYGFSDSAQFSRLFRAEFDQSPRQYRQRTSQSAASLLALPRSPSSDAWQSLSRWIEVSRLPRKSRV